MFTAIIESDIHTGNVYGLANPACVRDEYKEVARLLFDWRIQKIGEIGRVDVYINLGEVTDGPGRKSSIEHYTTDMEAQAEDAAENICMWNCDDYRLCYASKYHTGDGSRTEHMVVDKIKLNHNKRVDIKDMQRLEIDGIKINARHKIGNSGTPQGQASQVAKVATNDILRGVYRDYPGADLYFRAHTHQFAFAGNDMYAAYNNPAMQWPLGEYGIGIDRPFYTMGFLVLRIDNGQWTVQPYIFRAKLPEETYERIS